MTEFETHTIDPARLQTACKWYFQGEKYWGSYLKQKLSSKTYQQVCDLLERLESKREEQTKNLFLELEEEMARTLNPEAGSKDS